MVEIIDENNEREIQLVSGRVILPIYTNFDALKQFVDYIHSDYSELDLVLLDGGFNRSRTQRGEVEFCEKLELKVARLFAFFNSIKDSNLDHNSEELSRLSINIDSIAKSYRSELLIHVDIYSSEVIKSGVYRDFLSVPNIVLYEREGFLKNLNRI